MHHQSDLIKYFLLVSLILMVGTIDGHAQRGKYKFGDYIQFGRMSLEKGNFAEAIQYLNNAVKHRPANYEGYFLRGISKYYLDDYIGAELDFTEAIKYDPYNSDIFHFRAIVRSAQYNLGGSMADYARAIELNPKNPLFYLNRGRVHLFLRNYDSTIIDCNRAIERNFNKDDVYIIRGMAYRELEEYRSAIRDFNRAIKRNPENTNSYVQRGTVYIEMEEADSAIMDFNHAIRINPNDSYAIFQRGLARMETEDTTGAFADLNRVIELSPRNSHAYYNRAILKIGKGDDAGAIEDLDKVIALNPDNIVVYLYRGRIKAGTGNLEGAIEDFNKAIEIYPEFADAYYERSQVKEQMMDYKGAEEDYKLAYVINEFNFQRSDSLKIQEEMYLRRLMAFSGEFTDEAEPSDRIQDKMVNIDLKTIYTTVLFATSTEGVRFYDTYSKPTYDATLISLVNEEKYINERAAAIELNKINNSVPDKVDWEFYMKRAELHFEVRDYSAALQDFNNAILHSKEKALAFFGRANTRYKLIELMNLEQDEQYLFSASTEFDNRNTTHSLTTEQYSYDDVIRDYNEVIRLDPDFYFAWYNRGIVKSILGDYWGAIRDFSKALELDPSFSESYFNKGLLLIYLNLKTVGCRSISQAGELGIEEAYPVLKRYCIK